MTYYNMSFMDVNNTVFEMIQSINVESGGWAAGLMLLILFIILVIGMKHYNTKVAFITASWITALISIGLLFLGMVGWKTVGIYFVISLVASIIHFKFSED